MERIHWIDSRIKEAGGVSAAEIAARFEVAPRTAKRDIEYLKHRLRAPIVWSHPRQRYEYEAAFEGLSFADEKAILSCAFIQAMLAEGHIMPIASEALKRFVRKAPKGPYAAILDKIRYELPGSEPIAGRIAYAFCQALLTGHRLAIKYIDSSGAESERTIEPLRLVNYLGKWYCVALDGLRAELRIFALSRVKDAWKAAPRAFPRRPSEAEIEAFVSSSYGIFKGAPIGMAVLRFSGGAARAVREQAWHPAQEIRVLGEGEGGPRVELSLPVHDYTELLGRALRCGAGCEVIAPEEFRELWRAEIARMAALAGID
jgi:predicted DNA-binding transcriptional regulator YafY